MAKPPSHLICVGAIAGAFGVKGEVKVKPFTEAPENLMTYGPLLNEAGLVVLSPENYRLMKDFIAITASEINTREDAERLKSTKLYIPREALPEPDDDDFYHSDLIGLDVKSTVGRRIGKVVAVHEFGAGDMLEIQPAINKKIKKKSASFFHPFTKQATPKVDLKANRIIIEIFEAEDESGTEVPLAEK